MNSKKIINILCICSLLSAGCAGETASQKDETPHTPAKEDIIISGDGQYDLAEHFNSAEEMLALCDDVIYGEIIDYEMFSDGLINTLETIRVIETLYGNMEPGTEIVLMENGGYMLIKDYLDSLDEEIRAIRMSDPVYAELSEEEINSKYISLVPDGYYYPKISDRAVYCLKLRENMGNTYRLVGSWQGKYREVEDGVLAAPSNSSSLTDPDQTKAAGTITYEELKEQIAGAAAD